jgi:hypothetical protein
MRRRTVIAIALSTLALASCVPIFYDYYRPEAGPGRIEETGCWHLPDTIALDDKHGDAVRVQLYRLRGRYRVVMQYSVLGGNVIELTSTTVGVDLRGDGDEPKPMTGSWVGRRAVFGPMSGNYTVYADIGTTGASRVRVILPSTTVNGEQVAFPDVHFVKTVSIQAVINC